MMSENQQSRRRNSEQIVDALVKNCLHLTGKSSSSSTLQMTCDAITRLVPDANPEYVSHQLAKLSTHRDKKVESTRSESDVQSYIYSLLEENPKNSPKVVSNTTSLKFQSSGGFQMDSLSVALNMLQNNGTYNDEVSSPNMVIHVCDEAKNLKQDFDCPRDLLIQEMRYFAEYLSVDSQRLEEVDISVHCDIHIFDWLMRYVKRGTKLIDQSDVPRLDPNNVISILISSDFLKMDTLVEACISYCHKNMSVIVSTPCNMNCVNEKLTTMIAAKFSHNELEEIKDRKDKFKSKLFCKKLEKLFDSTYNSDSAGKASSLFKCLICQRVITHEQSSKLPCTNNRLSVGSSGGLTYKHEPDKSWDVSNYLICMYEDLHKWNLVYWRLWGVINHLTCSRCGQTFQLCDFGNCFYHPDRPQYQLSAGDTTDNPLGLFPCCNQRVMRFDPTGLNKGCRTKDHVVTTNDMEQRRTLDDLLTHKSLIKISLPICSSSSDLNIFSSEEMKCRIKETTMTPVEFYPPPAPILSTSSSVVPQKNSLRQYGSSPDNGEEDVAGEEDLPAYKRLSSVTSMDSASQHSFQAVTTGSSINLNTELSRTNTIGKKKDKIQVPIDSTTYNKYPSKQRWDTARSIRWNQDMQREEDRRRLTSISSNLSKQRSADRTDKTKYKDSRELPGGIFMKLEMAFFNNLKMHNHGGPQTQSFSRQYGNTKDLKSKLRR